MKSIVTCATVMYSYSYLFTVSYEINF